MKAVQKVKDLGMPSFSRLAWVFVPLLSGLWSTSREKSRARTVAPAVEESREDRRARETQATII